MALEKSDGSHHSLYGPGRNLRFLNIKDNLTKSHVLQDGEYNYTNNKLKRDFWKTSHSTDFSVRIFFCKTSLMFACLRKEIYRYLNLCGFNNSKPTITQAKL